MFNPITPWYPASIKPVRVGVYLADADHEARCPDLMRWTGMKWEYPNGQSTLYQERVWCGLSFDPSKVEPCHLDTFTANGWYTRAGYFIEEQK